MCEVCCESDGESGGEGGGGKESGEVRCCDGEFALGVVEELGFSIVDVDSMELVEES